MWPIAKIAKIKAATRNPVLCEFIFVFSMSIFVLSVKMQRASQFPWIVIR